jgi:hypothetical protein
MINTGSHEEHGQVERLKTFPYSAMYIGRAYVIYFGSHKKHGQVEETEAFSKLCYESRGSISSLTLKSWDHEEHEHI